MKPTPHPPKPPIPTSFGPQVPVHCIGLQAYLFPGEVSPELMAFRIDRLAELGLELYVTEFLFPTDWNNGNPVNLMSQVGGRALCGWGAAHQREGAPRSGRFAHGTSAMRSGRRGGQGSAPSSSVCGTERSPHWPTAPCVSARPVPRGRPASPQATLASTYTTWLTVWFSHPAIKAVLLWGFW